MADSSQTEAELDALYGLRPAEFVPARNALVKRLRASGRRAEADAVKVLPRPTVPAWAVNQLVRREPEWVQALATAGRRLEEAQATLIERGDRDAWRAAAADQRDAVDRLARLADAIVREERGTVTPAVRERIRDTLLAATVDPEACAAVRTGRLERELRAVGGLGAGPVVERAAPGPTARSRARRSREGEPEAANAGAPPGGSATAATEAAPGGAGAASEPAHPGDGGARPGDAAARRAAEQAERRARREAERAARATLQRAERAVRSARRDAADAARAADRARRADEAARAALADAEAQARERAEEREAAERAARDAATALERDESALAAAREALEHARD